MVKRVIGVGGESKDAKPRIIVNTMVKKKDLEKIGLEPQPLKFDDFVARCPEKLELRDGYMGQSKQDSKQLLAMSLQSFGLVETVKLAPKELWLEAIKQAYGNALDGGNETDRR